MTKTEIIKRLFEASQITFDEALMLNENQIEVIPYNQNWPNPYMQLNQIYHDRFNYPYDQYNVIVAPNSTCTSNPQSATYGGTITLTNGDAACNYLHI